MAASNAEKHTARAHFLAGALGGTVSACVTCPLEVVKTRLQAHDGIKLRADRMFAHIIRTEGISGLWKGLLPNVLGVAPARAVHFSIYSKMKDTLSSQGYSGTTMHLMSAGTAAGCSATVTSPLWVIKTRLQLDAAKTNYTTNAQRMRSWVSSMVNAASSIYKVDGFRGFYRGLGASYLGISESALQFAIYEQLKRMAAKRRQEDQSSYRAVPADVFDSNDETGGGSADGPVPAQPTPSQPASEPSSLQPLVLGATAKLIASVSTYPHEVLRTRMREAANSGPNPRYRGLVHAVREIVRAEGMRGLYGGLLVHQLRTVPNAAILFFVVELVVGGQL